MDTKSVLKVRAQCESRENTSQESVHTHIHKMTGKWISMFFDIHFSDDDSVPQEFVPHVKRKHKMTNKCQDPDIH